MSQRGGLVTRASPHGRVGMLALLDPSRQEVAEYAVYLAEIDAAQVRPPGVATDVAGPLPDEGSGSLDALRALIAAADAGATRSAGPRFFHFVMGGGTPAALAADWLTSAIDQIAFNWISSPFAMQLEQISVGWLKELFGLPASWSGVLTTGATTANFTGLAAARRWWGLQHGVDVEEEGLSALPPVPVLASGHVHASAVKTRAPSRRSAQRMCCLLRAAWSAPCSRARRPLRVRCGRPRPSAPRDRRTTRTMRRWMTSW